MSRSTLPSHDYSPFSPSSSSFSLLSSHFPQTRATKSLSSSSAPLIANNSYCQIHLCHYQLLPTILGSSTQIHRFFFSSLTILHHTILPPPSSTHPSFLIYGFFFFLTTTWVLNWVFFGWFLGYSGWLGFWVVVGGLVFGWLGWFVSHGGGWVCGLWWVVSWPWSLFFSFLFFFFSDMWIWVVNGVLEWWWVGFFQNR